MWDLHSPSWDPRWVLSTRETLYRGPGRLEDLIQLFRYLVIPLVFWVLITSMREMHLLLG